tara:strand:+ start:75 stop:731 length:657 start_codon:yes stop_codon:yes gene_type:complete
MSDMKQLDARQELLVITMEECGELIQACSKALRRGELFAYSDSETELKQEIADVQAMINLMVEWDVLSWTEIENGVERKRNKLKRWSKLIEDAEWEKTVKESPVLTEENGEIYAEDIEDEVHDVDQPDPPKSQQQQKNFPSNSVTWRQALGDDPRPYVDEKGYGRITYTKEYTQDMTGTGDYINTVDTRPMTEQEERQWDELYKKQVEESQRNGKETL